MNIFISANEFFNIYNFRLNLIKKIGNKYPFANIILMANFDGYEKKIILKNKKFFVINSKISSRSYNLKENIISFLIYIKNILHKKPDLVISYTIKSNFYFLVLKFFFKFKLIINITGLGEIYLNKSLKNKIIFKTYKTIIKKSDLIVFQNSSDLEIISNTQDLKNKSTVIPGSGVDVNIFNFKKMIKKNNIKFTFIGRLIEEKGIIEFLKAIIKIKKLKNINANFLIIGSKYYDNIIFNKSFDRYLKIAKIKHINYTDKIHKYIEDTDFVVLPSYREGLSKSLLEAISMGRPIITSDVPGCNVLVKNGINGFLVKQKSYISIYNALIRSLKLPWQTINKMGLKSFQISKNYSEHKINNSYLNIINEIL